MYARVLKAACLLIGGLSLMFTHRQAIAQDPSATPTSSFSGSACCAHFEANSSNETAETLRAMQRLIREQAEKLDRLQEKVERQNREINELYKREKSVASNSTGGLEEGPAELTLRLNAATDALQTQKNPDSNEKSPVQNAEEAQEFKDVDPKTDDSANLYFRIGNATFTPNGWIDFTSYYRDTNVGSGLGTNFQLLPYRNSVQGGESEFRMTAQASRFGMKVDETIGRFNAYGYLEADFNGYPPGNTYVSTNSNTLRMRVYYLNISGGKWEILGGQGWSLMTPTRKALSPFLADLFTTFHLDTSYQAGLVYARQAQFRLIYHPSNTVALGVSLENPEQYSGSAVTFPSLFSDAETDINSSSGNGGGTATPNRHPDIIAKVTLDRTVHGLYWHAGVAGLLTSVRVYTPLSITKGQALTDSREGGGFIGNLFIEMFKGFHLLGLGYWSDGGGRYLGGMGPGFVVLQPNSSTSAFNAALIHSGSAIAGFEWTISPRTTISSYYSQAYFQRRYGLDPEAKTATYIGYGYPGSPDTQNRSIQETTFASITTIWQKPSYGALQFITQSSYASRAPWYVAPGHPEKARAFMEFVNLRYVLP